MSISGQPFAPRLSIVPKVAPGTRRCIARHGAGKRRRMSDMRILGWCAVFFIAVAARAATLNGVWGVTITRFGEPQYQRVTLHTSGEKLTGESGDMTIEGTAQGDAVSF